MSFRDLSLPVLVFLSACASATASPATGDGAAERGPNSSSSATPDGGASSDAPAPVPEGVAVAIGGVTMRVRESYVEIVGPATDYGVANKVVHVVAVLEPEAKAGFDVVTRLDASYQLEGSVGAAKEPAGERTCGYTATSNAARAVLLDAYAPSVPGGWSELATARGESEGSCTMTIAPRPAGSIRFQGAVSGEVVDVGDETARRAFSMSWNLDWKSRATDAN